MKHRQASNRTTEPFRLFTWRPGTLAQGTLVMTAGMGLRTLAQTGVFLIVTRVIGIELYGVYSAVLALAMTLGGFAGLGVSVIMLRDTSRHREAFAEAWGRTLTVLLITVLPLLVLYGSLAWAALPAGIGWLVVVCIGLAEIFFAPLTLAATQAYQGHERLGRSARLVLMPVLTRLAVALLLPLAFLLPAAAAARLSVWAAAYLLSAVMAAVYALWLLRKDFGLDARLHWHGLMRAVRAGWPFALAGVARKVYVDVDKIMLARFSTLEAAGAYAAAYRVVDMATVPLLSFFSAAIPRFFRAGRHGLRSVTRYAWQVLPLPMAYVLVAGIALYALAGLLPWLLGAQFGPAVEALRWLAGLPLLSLLRQTLQNALTGADRQRVVMGILLAGAVFNIGLNLWLIPTMAWKGAVLAAYAAEFLMAALFALAFFKTTPSDK